MTVETVALMGTRPQWREHVAPLEFELARRGVIPSWEDEWSVKTLSRSTPVVVSSWDDAMAAHRGGSRRIVLMEHGAGQSYSNRHTSYPGGQQRHKLSLVLAPNDQAAARHRRHYRSAPPVEVVGCPKIDWMASAEPKPADYPPIVAVTWHWDCLVAPEAGSAWSHKGGELLGPAILAELVRMRDLGFIELLGHAHPRIAEEVKPAYRAADVQFVGLEEVFRRADVLMVDNSSALFEFVALDRPVIVVDSPRYRLRANHGLRFWDFADVGPRIWGPDQVHQAVVTALEDAEPYPQRRRQATEVVYPLLGRSTEAAVDAILAHFDV